VVAARCSIEQSSVPIGLERAREPELVHLIGGQSPNVEPVPCRVTPDGVVVEEGMAMPSVQGRLSVVAGIRQEGGRGGKEGGVVVAGERRRMMSPSLEGVRRNCRNRHRKPGSVTRRHQCLQTRAAQTSCAASSDGRRSRISSTSSSISVGGWLCGSGAAMVLGTGRGSDRCRGEGLVSRVSGRGVLL